MSDDPYVDDVIVLLPFDGDDGSTSVTDYAPLPGAVQLFDGAQLTIDARDERSALNIPTSGAYAQYTFAALPALGNADFTIEFWLNLPDFPSSGRWTIFDWRPTRSQYAPWLVVENQMVHLRSWYTGSPTLSSGTGSIRAGEWHHIALSRHDWTFRLFVDGVLRDQIPSTVNYVDPAWSDILLGRNVHEATPEYFQGRLQDLRVTMGVGRYVAGFTPPERLLASGGGGVAAWAELASPLFFKSAFGHTAWAEVFDTVPWIDASGIKYPARPWRSKPVLRSGKVQQKQTSALRSGPFTPQNGRLAFAYRVIAAEADALRITVHRATGGLVETLVEASGLGDWVDVSFDPAALPPGAYLLQFSFIKQSPAPIGADGAFLIALSGFPLPAAWGALPSPLKALSAQAVTPAQSFLTAKARLDSPLQPPMLLAARLSAALGRMRSPLGVPVLFGAPPVSGWGALAKVLGSPQATSAIKPFIWSSLASPLGVASGRGRQVRVLEPPLLAKDLLELGVGARLLSDLLPLRRSVELPEYRVDTWLPWVYGRVTLAAVGLDAERIEWLIADHPVIAVEAVEVGGVATDGWQLIQRVDDSGHPIALIRLTQPAKASDQVAVRVVGKRHPRTGEVLSSPAQIAIDVLTACGWQLSPDAFGGLTDDLPGVEVGIVFDGPVSVRKALSQLFEPLGAIWAAGPLATPSARLDVPGTASFVLDTVNCEEVSARAEHVGLATVARVVFDYDWAAKSARQAMTIHAPEAVDRYGEIVADLDMPAVRTARDALALGSALLARRARARWTIDVELVSGGTLPEPGDTVRVDHPHLPAGLAVVHAHTLSRQEHLVRLTLHMATGITPAVTLTSRSRLFNVADDSMSVQYRDGWATFTITDDQGNSLSGAAVTLDGITTRNTDVRGQVQFKTQRGAHTLSVYAHGYAPFEMDVIV